MMRDNSFTSKSSLSNTRIQNNTDRFKIGKIKATVQPQLTSICSQGKITTR